jgi:catechol 1,2-dioxygenase
MTEVNTVGNRIDTILTDLLARIRGVILDHRVTEDEYAAAKQYLISVGEAGEWPLLADVFLGSTVERLHSDALDVDGAIEGPFYIPGAPELTAPYVMPMREGEGGDVLVFTGSVAGKDGQPIDGAEIDMWQCDSRGTYAGIPYPDGRELPPQWNLRGRFRTDGSGDFEVRTILPVPYEIPKAGPTGALLRAAGWHPFRPAHLHARVSAPGYHQLITQLYFEGDPYIESDIVNGVKAPLICKLDKRDGPGGRAEFTTSYDFRLAAV